MNKNKEVKVMKYSDAVVRVHRPVLSEEERQKRMKEIERAAAELLKG